ncbi:hypothetical protein STENM327S_07197 [Streptomyces tendae]
MKQPRAALVTGAGGALGRATAVRLAADGHDVAVLDRDADDAPGRHRFGDGPGQQARQVRGRRLRAHRDTDAGVLTAHRGRQGAQHHRALPARRSRVHHEPPRHDGPQHEEFEQQEAGRARASAPWGAAGRPGCRRRAEDVAEHRHGGQTAEPWGRTAQTDPDQRRVGGDHAGEDAAEGEETPGVDGARGEGQQPRGPRARVLP